MKDGLLSLFKFVLAVALIPVVIAVAGAFNQELLKLEELHGVFICGVITYIFLNLFIVSAEGFYAYGQRLLGDFCKGSAFLGNYLPKVIPLYLTLLLVVYYILAALLKMKHIDTYFMFFAGFLLAMHVVLTSQEIEAEDGSVAKPHYFLTAGLVFVLNILFIALLLDLDFSQFRYLEFLKAFWTKTETIYTSVYKKLLLIK